MAAPEVLVDTDSTHHWHRPALAVFLAGLTVWIVATAITAQTKDDILIPTVILVGSFLVPVTVVVAAFHREETRVGTGLSMPVMLEGFLFSGMLGVVATALIETYTLPKVAGTFIAVAIIEETGKAIVIVLVSLRLKSRQPLDGLVLGAIVGAGFAAFESAGYAFDAYIQYGSSKPFLNLLQTEINRALLSPFGHIVWTALIGGALFAAARPNGHFRITRSVVATYLGVVTLHALWDEGFGWSIILTRGFTGEGWHIGWPNAAAWVSDPSRHQLSVFSTVYNGALIVIGVVGIVWFVLAWRSYKRRELAELAQQTAEPAEAPPILDLRSEAERSVDQEATRPVPH